MFPQAVMRIRHGGVVEVAAKQNILVLVFLYEVGNFIYLPGTQFVRGVNLL